MISQIRLCVTYLCSSDCWMNPFKERERTVNCTLEIFDVTLDCWHINISLFRFWVVNSCENSKQLIISNNSSSDIPVYEKRLTNINTEIWVTRKWSAKRVWFILNFCSRHRKVFCKNFIAKIIVNRCFLSLPFNCMNSQIYFEKRSFFRGIIRVRVEKLKMWPLAWTNLWWS